MTGTVTTTDDLGRHITLGTVKTDADIAEELRTEARPHFDAIAALQNRAVKHGMVLGFQLARDQFGRNFVQSIDVVKPL